jgi:hypothetical protein
LLADGEHCSDLWPSLIYQPEVAAARAQIKEQIGKYLNDPMCAPETPSPGGSVAI